MSSAKSAIECLRQAAEAMTRANSAIDAAEHELRKIGFTGAPEGQKLTDLMLYQRRAHAQLAFHMGAAEVTIRRVDTVRRLGGKS